MQIELQGFDRLNQAFMRAPELVESELSDWIRRAGLHMQREVQMRTPVREGTLKDDIKLGVERVGKLGVTAEISTSLNYARPIEFGSKPHDIVAKNGGALRFMFRGVPIMVKKVHHPGFEGAHMFKKAFDANASQLQTDFDQFVDRLLNKIFQA